MMPHMRNLRKLKVDLGQVNPETFQHAGHMSLVRGAGAAAIREGSARHSPSDLQGHLSGPPGLIARADLRLPRATEPSTEKPKRRVRRQGTCSPPSKPSTPILRPQRPLRTPLLAALGRADPVRRGHPPQTSSLANSDARLPFLLLVSCHCRRAALRPQTPELPGRWGIAVAAFALALAYSCGPGRC